MIKEVLSKVTTKQELTQEEVSTLIAAINMAMCLMFKLPVSK